MGSVLFCRSPGSPSIRTPFLWEQATAAVRPYNGAPTADAILALRFLSNLHREFNQPLYAAFDDLKSAFDLVDQIQSQPGLCLDRIMTRVMHQHSIVLFGDHFFDVDFGDHVAAMEYNPADVNCSTKLLRKIYVLKNFQVCRLFETVLWRGNRIHNVTVFRECSLNF